MCWQKFTSRILVSVALAVIFFRFVLPAEGSSLLQTDPKEGQPISIRADKMMAKNNENKIVFEDNVEVSQGDLWMRADRVEVFFGVETGSTSVQTPFILGDQTVKEIHRIEAVGNVDLKQGNRRATAGHAVYHHEEEKIILTESPVVWEKDYKVAGKTMTFFLNENRSVVEESQVVIQNTGVKE